MYKRVDLSKWGRGDVDYLMKVLFMCKTPYQILVATRVIYQKYQQDHVDLVLFDTIANVETLINNIRHANVFDNVYTYKCRDTYEYRRVRKRVAYIAPLPKFPVREIYDVVFIANVYDWVEDRIIVRMKKINPQTHIYMYEDGFASYSSHYGDFFEIAKKKSIKNRLLYSVYRSISGFYVYSPDLMTWEPECNMMQIEKIEPDEDVFRKKVNKIFGYENILDLYEQKYIFFEESYYADGINVNDMAAVDMIADTVGKENILVKIHPRNKVNRFKENGYITNANTEIPWEVIAMNIDLSDKILITIASGSALTSLINMASVPKKIIMLMQCNEIDYNSLTPTRDFLLHIAHMRSDCIVLPKNYDEARAILRSEEV